MKGEAALVDTNILVYAYDTFDKNKNEKCRRLVESAFGGEESLAVSNQILSELFFVLTKKLRKPFSADDAGAIVFGIADSVNWVKINYNHETVKCAVEISKNRGIAIWDSLVIATSLENGITKIYTENTKDFEKEDKINAVNPL